MDKVEAKTLLSFPELSKKIHHQKLSQEEMDELYLKISNVYLAAINETAIEQKSIETNGLVNKYSKNTDCY